MRTVGASQSDTHIRGYLGLGIIWSVSVLFGLIQFQHAREMTTTLGTSVFALLPFGVTVALFGAGYLAWNSRLANAEMLRIAGWVVFGVVLIGLLATWTIAHQTSHGEPFHHIHFVTVNNMCVGGFIGFLLGWYDTWNRRHRRDVSDERTKLGARQQRLEIIHRLLRHNLRTDLNVISGYAANIQERTTGQNRDAARLIRETTDQLTDMSEKTQHMLTTLDRESDAVAVDVATVCARSVERVRDADTEVEFVSEASDRALAYAISADLLEIAITNLLENAIEYNDGETPRVAVSVSTAEADSDRVLVQVTDNGPGIPEMERIVLSEGRETPLSHGSGIGLWLVSWIVTESGGELEFEENDPRGSVVSVSLPSVTDASN